MFMPSDMSTCRGIVTSYNRPIPSRERGVFWIVRQFTSVSQCSKLISVAHSEIEMNLSLLTSLARMMSKIYHSKNRLAFAVPVHPRPPSIRNTFGGYTPVCKTQRSSLPGYDLRRVESHCRIYMPRSVCVLTYSGGSNGCFS